MWLGLPQAANAERGALDQMQTVSEPFVWGSGGSRMTPEDIAFQRRLAASQQQMDYSPVGHWLQGAARLADTLGGAFRERRADRAAAENAAEGDAVMRALMGGGQGSSTEGVTAALLNPYIPDNVRDFAMKQWERANPKPPQPTDFQRNFQWLQGMNPSFADKYLQGQIDPEIVVPTPTGPYVGPRSQLSATIGEGGGQQSGPVGGTPPPAPQGSFADMSGAGDLIRSMGAKGFLDWQQRHGTPVMVSGPEDMAKLPSGTKVVSPDGRTGVKK
jgi:hypothetical protein